MKIRCVAIDDEPLALDLVCSYISKIPELQLINKFDDAIAGIRYLSENPVDLLFLDINMPDISGIDLLRSLRQKPMAIFTTAYKEFAYEGFDLDAVDYVLKPISFERFSRAAKKGIDYFRFKQNTTLPDNDVLFVRSEYQLIRIELDDIEYIESLDDYLKIHLTNAKPVMTLMTLKTLEEKLPGKKFKRIHRSYVIALSKVRSFSNKKVVLYSLKELPVSNSYLAGIIDWIKK